MKAPVGLMAFALCSAILLYSISPMFTATHFEVLSAQVQINAIAANEHRLALANVLYPIHTEYFYLTRIGVVYLIQLSALIFGNGDLAFRAVTVASFVTYLAASIVVARRYTKVSRTAATIALVMAPGIISTGFFFNDNVVSMGLGMLGLALMPPPEQSPNYVGITRGLVAGMLLGLALLARADAFLLLPIAAALALLETKNWRLIVLSGIVTSAGVAATLLISYLVSGVSIVQILKIGRFFELIHDEKPRGHIGMAVLALLFIGLPNLFLVPLGASFDFRRNGILRNLVLIGLPLCLFVFFAGHALETRMFFPMLAPFVAMHAGKGLEWTWSNLKPGSDNRKASLISALLLALIWLAPPIYVPVKEGPRPLLGQMWAPLLWYKWQEHENAGVAAAQHLITAAEQVSDPVALTLDYTADAFLRLKLWQSGYRPVSAQTLAPACQPDFEAWQDGMHTLLTVRTENPHQFVPEPHDYVEAIEIYEEFRCDIIGRSQHIFAFGSLYFARDSEVAKYITNAIPEIVPLQISFGWPQTLSAALARKIPISAIEPMTMVQQGFTLLSRDQEQGLLDAADRELARQRATSDRSLRGLQALRSEWGYHFWRPDAR